MLNRHEYREKIVFALYQHLLLHKDIDLCFEENFEDDDSEFVLAVRNDLKQNKESYIAEISSYLNKWTFDRLNLVEQAILLETVSEIKQGLNDKAVAHLVLILPFRADCDEESYKFINGVLDQVCSSSR